MQNAVWHAVVFEIGRGYTRELSIMNIQDISYSFEKQYKLKISQLKIIDSFSAF